MCKRLGPVRVRRSKYPLLLLLLSLSPSGLHTSNNGQLTEPWIACGTTILLTWHASDAGWTKSTEASFSFPSVCCRLLEPEKMEVCISAVANLRCIGPAWDQSQRNPSLIGNPRFRRMCTRCLRACTETVKEPSQRQVKTKSVCDWNLILSPQSMFYMQFCPLFREARRQQWPRGAAFQEQRWNNMEDLVKTTTFVQATGVTTWGRTMLECSRRWKIIFLIIDPSGTTCWFPFSFWSFHCSNLHKGVLGLFEPHVVGHVRLKCACCHAIQPKLTG